MKTDEKTAREERPEVPPLPARFFGQEFFFGGAFGQIGTMLYGKEEYLWLPVSEANTVIPLIKKGA